MMSEPMPQKKLPQQRPTNNELVVYRTVFSDTPNSAERDGRVNETPYNALVTHGQGYIAARDGGKGAHL